MTLQSILSILYPAQCIACENLIAEDAALCPDCWRDTPFIQGAVCHKCGAPLMGDAPGDETAKCDDCLVTERPWDSGTSVLVYKGITRRLILAFKHGDRQDLVRPFAVWAASKIRANLGEGDVLIPVPIHWRRLIKRRYNQSSLVAHQIAALTGAKFMPDALVRTRHTKPQEGLSFQERFDLQRGTIRTHPTRSKELAGRRVFIVDDVMTSGATMSVAARAAKSAGATKVHTITLARVVKEH